MPGCIVSRSRRFLATPSKATLSTAVAPSLACLAEWWQEFARQPLESWANPGELAAAYVVYGAKRTAGKRWQQGPRDTPFATRLGCSDVVQFLAENRVFRVEHQVAQCLVAWDAGDRPLDLLAHVPAPLEVLRAQSQGRRFVSLLPEGADPGLQPSVFEFALHDLCHAEKYLDPAHHLGQVGFFAALYAAVATAAWHELVAPFDAEWPAEWAHVAADMNGSAVFLFSALRRKVYLAAGRAGLPVADSHELLFEAMALHGEVREAARAFTIHPRADPEVSRARAETLLAGFVARGEVAMSSNLAVGRLLGLYPAT